MYNIYCLQGFNNYYNRVVKKFPSVDSYISHQEINSKEYASFGSINFMPNDCVNTEQILNWPNKWLPDYFVVEDQDTGIFSCWFVMESVRQRGQQYLFQLRRDLLVDYYDTILNAPVFIEKAILKPTDPFIYNNENMTFNQIKTSETPLKDRSGCPWIVGYYADLGAGNDKIITTPSNQQYDLEVEGTYSGWALKNYFDAGSLNVSTQHNFFSGFSNDWTYNTLGSYHVITGVACNDRTEQFYDAEFLAVDDGDSTDAINKTYSQLVLKQDSGCDIGAWNYDFRKWDDDNFNPYTEFAAPYKAKGIDDINSTINNAYFSNMTYYDFSNELLKVNNKIIRFKTSSGGEEFYKFTITKKTTSDPNATFVSSRGNVKVIESEYPTKDDLWQKLYAIQKATPGWVLGNVQKEYYFYTQVIYDQYTLTATQIEASAYKTEIKVGKNKLLDAPYSMFAIPYIEENTDGELSIDAGSGNIYPVQRGVSMTVVNSIIEELQPAQDGKGFIYDVQLLPYCPVPELIYSNSRIKLPTGNNYYYEPIYTTVSGTPGTVPQSYVFFAKKSQFTIDIPLNISYNNKKIESQTDLYRLVSPNYNGQFEFNIAKNNGITKVNVDCTYKPFNPYIHVNPDFNNLYGSDWNDARGLICNGDFSLTMISDAWEQYQISNKNYQNIFDRDIQNMEVNNSVARKRDVYRGITGALTGGMTGAIGGAKGGVAGAIAGAVGGTAAGAVGGMLNYEWNEILRNEAIDYKVDQFGYNLGNIQALPQSISKTTAFTANNKIYPILEYYTCTNEEKIALANKIAYNSMTVMRIGTIGEFINNSWSFDKNFGEGYPEYIMSKGYIKGQIIRIEDINCDDFHVANEIANEIFKGAFYDTYRTKPEK